MSDKPNDTEGKKERRGRGETSTKPAARGEPLPVENPTDLWYLCQKIDYARNNPLTRSDGVRVFQRVVTNLIRRDCKVLKYHFPWVGEVGFDMTTAPPLPIMSKNDPQRPSEFPLSQYSRIYNNALKSMSVQVRHAIVTKQELENELPLPTQERRGLLRIPDVITLENFLHSGGSEKYSQGNIVDVIEIKFPNDKLSPEQRRDYTIIAGDENNFRLMHTKQCPGFRRKRPWEEEAKANNEPAFSAAERAEGLNNGTSSLHPYPLTEEMIRDENDRVRRAYDDFYRRTYNDEHRISELSDGSWYYEQQEELRRSRQNIEQAVALPFYLIAATVAAMPAVEAGAGAAITEGATILRSGTHVIPTAGQLIRIAGGTAAVNAAIYEAAADDKGHMNMSIYTPRQPHKMLFTLPIAGLESYTGVPEAYLHQLRYLNKMTEIFYFIPDYDENYQLIALTDQNT